MPICKACASEADDRAKMGDGYMNEVVRGSFENPKKYGHYCGHACCGESGCTCQHRVNTGRVLA